jgi:hypothetical protein
VGEGGKKFFFEKKNQKTFESIAHLAEAARDGITKFFGNCSPSANQSNHLKTRLGAEIPGKVAA